MPRPLDAAALAAVKAAVEQMTPGPWAFENVDEQADDYNVGVALNEKDEPVAGEIHATDELYIDESVAVELSRHNARAIVALVNAAPALVAGCETLAKVETLIGDLMNEARRLREAAVDDDQNDRWIAAGERENLACRLRDLLAALDAAREE